MCQTTGHIVLILLLLASSARRRGWSAYNKRHGTEISHGLLEHIFKLMAPAGITEPPALPEESEGKEAGVGGAQPQPPPQGGEIASLPPFVKLLDDGVSPFMGYIQQGGEFHLFANEAFGQLFMTQEALRARFKDLGVLPCCLLSL
jgi:hypothetical protein